MTSFCVIFYTLLVLPVSRCAYSKLVDSAAWKSVEKFFGESSNTAVML